MEYSKLHLANSERQTGKCSGEQQESAAGELSVGYLKHRIKS